MNQNVTALERKITRAKRRATKRTNEVYRFVGWYIGLGDKEKQLLALRELERLAIVASQAIDKLHFLEAKRQPSKK